MKDKLKKKLKKVVPFILIAVLSCTAVLFSYDKGNEVQAAVVVDDIMVVTTILALCGVSFLGTEELWGDGNGWYPGIDAGQDIDEWIDDFNKPWSEEWDEKTREYALEHGLIDENGNYTGGGDDSGDGGDDDDHKFPSWQKIKTLVKANGGNVATALGAYLPLLTGFAQSVLYDSGSKLSDYMLNDGLKIDERYITSSTTYIASMERPYWFGGTRADTIIYNDNAISCIIKDDSSSKYGYAYIAPVDGKGHECSVTYLLNGEFVKNKLSLGPFGSGSFDTKIYSDYIVSFEDLSNYTGKIFYSLPVFSSVDKAVNYLTSEYKKENNLKKYINPTSIGTDSNLKDKMQTGVDGIPVLPKLPINDFAKLPTMDDLKDFFKKIGNDKDDKDKRQKDIDDFIKKITTADTGGGETPNPNPSPDPGGGETPEPNPGGGGSGGGGGGTTTDTPDKPDKDDDNSKKDYARDLQKIFPFCIPFDIVDCFKLFKAEPETPRVEIPIHFGIVEKDYTFVIDLKDFNNVALMLRSSLLIVFVVGLGFATRNVIKW